MSLTAELRLDIDIPRVIALEGVHNFRDLGGYRTRDGRSVRPRTLFRSDGLDRATAGDLEALRPLGLNTVVDLRTDGEIERRGRFAFESYPVQWHHLPVIDVTWDREAVSQASSAADYLYQQYSSMLAAGEPRILEAFLLLGLPGALPAVFHCAAGKDRTGILAALVLGALGVDDETIAADYALTAPAMERIRAWAERDGGEMAEAVRSMPAHFGAVEPLAVLRLLADVRRAHGSVRAYVTSLGVPTAVLDSLDERLLVDPA